MAFRRPDQSPMSHLNLTVNIHNVTKEVVQNKYNYTPHGTPPRSPPKKKKHEEMNSAKYQVGNGLVFAEKLYKMFVV